MDFLCLQAIKASLQGQEEQSQQPKTFSESHMSYK